jgi:hypothetical protein
MAGSVTLYLTSASAGAGNFQIYHTSADPGNLIAQNVSSASLAAGYCTNEVYSTYVVKSDTVDCQNQVLVYPGGAPVPTPTPTLVGPTPTPSTLPTLTDGWRITAGAVTFGGGSVIGYHRGTVYGCPTPAVAIGSEVSPTTTTVNLPGTDCYWTSIFGANISKGYGVTGIGAASNITLTQFTYDNSSGILVFAATNGTATSNIGNGSLSGTIVGNNSTSGTWSVNYTVGTTYVDNNGAGTSYTVESTGTMSISGLTLTNGVTYNITV